MDKLKLRILLPIIEAVLGMLTPDLLRDVLDKLFDAVEDAIANSETKLDDAVLLPLITTARAAFNIPDND